MANRQQQVVEGDEAMDIDVAAVRMVVVDGIVMGHQVRDV